MILTRPHEVAGYFVADGGWEAFEEAFPGRMSGKNDDTDWSDPAGFLLPGFSFYGILFQERNGSEGIPSSKLEGILLLFYYFWLPRFAAICRA